MEKELESFMADCDVYITAFQKSEQFVNHSQERKDYFESIKSLMAILKINQKKQDFNRQVVEVTVPTYGEGLTFTMRSSSGLTGYLQHPCDKDEFKKGIYSRILTLNDTLEGECTIEVESSTLRTLATTSFVKKANTQVVLNIRAEDLSNEYEQVNLGMNVKMKEIHSVTILSSSNKEIKKIDNINIPQGKSADFKLDRSNPADTYKIVVTGLSSDDKVSTETDFAQIKHGEFLILTVSNFNALIKPAKGDYNFKVNAKFEVKTINIVEKGNERNEIASASYLALKSDSNLLNHSTAGPTKGVFYLLQVQGVNDRDVMYFDIPFLTSSSKVNVKVSIVADLVTNLDWDNDIKTVIDNLYKDKWANYGQTYFIEKAENYLNNNGSSTFGDMLNLGLAGTLLYSGTAPFSAFTFITLNILKKALSNAVAKGKKIKLAEIKRYVELIFDTQKEHFLKNESIKIVSKIKKDLYAKSGGIFMTTAEIKISIELNNAQIIDPSKIKRTIDDCFKK
jgi:hypothetical protein